MNTIREAVRLVKVQQLSRNKAAAVLQIGKSTVKDYLTRFESSGLALEAFLTLQDGEVASKLFEPRSEPADTPDRQEPDMDYILQELARPCVTAKKLWEEYIQIYPSGIRYTQFCERISKRQDKRPLSMRREHVPGRTVYADYSGERPEYIDLETGELRKAELLVMAWGASNFTYAEAQESQKVGCWTMGHVRAFGYFGCAPYELTPDCLKSGVIKAHRYDPTVNRTYVELCTHYGIAPIPARPLEPRDKAKAEKAVQAIQHRILASLRDRIFHGFAELNAAIRECLEEFNDRPMESYGRQTRRELFESMDKPAAQPLPMEAWEHREWIIRHAGSDYCVEIDKHWYSVPWQHRGKSIHVKLTEKTIQAYVDNERVATHVRSTRKYAHTILTEHMPERHAQSLPVDAERLLWRARNLGPGMLALCEHRIARSPHKVEGLRPIQGLLRMAERLGDNARADRAATYALSRGMTSCDGYKKVLESRVAEREPEEELGFVKHGNLHGETLFHKEA
jgi:transposase